MQLAKGTSGLIIARDARRSMGASPSPDSIHWLLGGAVTILAAIIAYHFHDRSWWAPDDGAYAYVAWRLLEGDVLGREVADVHPGYINFLNAAAMRTFGVDVVVMRYPLIAITVAQSALTYWILRTRGAGVAVVGALAGASLTFILFINPTANWYALFLASCTAGVLSWRRFPFVFLAPSLGFLIATTFLFRQLSGVFLAMGVLSWFLLHYRATSPAQATLMRALIAVMSVVLGAYLISKESLSAFLLFGIWPFFVFWHCWLRSGIVVAPGTGLVFGPTFLASMAAGAGLAIIPLGTYHLLHGTLELWLHDSFVVPFSLVGFDFFRNASFIGLIARGAILFPNTATVGVLNLTFWLLLFLAPVLLGARVVTALRSTGESIQLSPLSIIAVFYGLVSVHYEIPIYLSYTSFLTLAGLLSIASPRAERNIYSAAILALCLIAVLFQAGQPPSRGINAILTGQTVTLDAPAAHQRASVRIAKSEQSTLAAVLAVASVRSPQDGRMLTAPFNPEFYFLAEQRAPFRFGITALEMQGVQGLRRALGNLRADPPTLLIHRREDKYNTPEVLALVDEVSRWSGQRDSIGEFDLYFDIDPQRSRRSQVRRGR